MISSSHSHCQTIRTFPFPIDYTHYGVYNKIVRSGDTEGQAMKKVTIIIPKRDNEGNKFPTNTMAEIQKEILRNYGGYTVREVRGAWLGDDGKTYIDDSWEYVIVMDDKGVEVIKKWLVKVRDLLRQQAMYLEVSEAEVKFI